ncbi:ankyrin repeat domain-containing protein 27-like [Lissotriton helveticus]
MSRDGHSLKPVQATAKLRTNIKEKPLITSASYSLKNIEDATEFLGRHTEKFDKIIASFHGSFKEYERKSLRHYIDSVNAIYTKCLQHLLRDSHWRAIAKQEPQMNQIKQAVEMYVHHGIHELIFKCVGTIESSEDAAFNKITRGLQDLQQKDIGIKPEFSTKFLIINEDFYVQEDDIRLTDSGCKREIICNDVQVLDKVFKLSAASLPYQKKNVYESTPDFYVVTDWHFHNFQFPLLPSRD